MKKLSLTILLLTPALGSDVYLDVIKFKLTENCSFSEYLVIVQDFNTQWGQSNGYSSRVAMPLQDDDLGWFNWICASICELKTARNACVDYGGNNWILWSRAYLNQGTDIRICNDLEYIRWYKNFIEDFRIYSSVQSVRIYSSYSFRLSDHGTCNL